MEVVAPREEEAHRERNHEQVVNAGEDKVDLKWMAGVRRDVVSDRVRPDQTLK